MKIASKAGRNAAEWLLSHFADHAEEMVMFTRSRRMARAHSTCLKEGGPAWQRPRPRAAQEDA